MADKPKTKGKLDGTEFTYLGETLHLSSLDGVLDGVDSDTVGPAVQSLSKKLTLTAELPKAGMTELLKVLAGMTEEQVVKLANAPGDWDPKDHPKDHLGKFIKKGHGTYLFGKVKKAMFAGHKVEIEPGSKATEVTKVNGTKWLVIEDHEGNFKALTTDGPGGSLKSAPVGADSNLAKAANANAATPPHLKPKLLQVAPVTEVDAASLTGAKVLINSTAGKPIVDLPGGGKTWLEKNQVAWSLPTGPLVITTDGAVDDVYLPDSNEPMDDAVVDQAEWTKTISAEGKVITTGASKVASTPTSGLPAAEPKDLPIGTVLTHKATGKAVGSYTKQAENSWLASLDNNLYTDASLKPGYTMGAFDVTLQALNKPKPPPSVTAGGDTFTHPVSGEQANGVVELHQHKTSPNSYLAKNSTGSWIFFDKNGKAKLASQQTHLKYLKTNYKLIQQSDAPPTAGGVPFEQKYWEMAQVGDKVSFVSGGTGNLLVFTKVAKGSKGWALDDIVNTEDDLYFDSAVNSLLKQGKDATFIPKIETMETVGTTDAEQAIQNLIDAHKATPAGAKTTLPNGDVWQKTSSGPSAVWQKVQGHDAPSGEALNAEQFVEMLASDLVKQPEPAGPQTAGSFQLPNGETIELTPGVTVFESQGNVVVFHPDGSGTKYYKNGTTSPYIGKKDHYKAWNVLAEAPLPKLDAPDLADITPDDVPKGVSGHNEYLASRKQKLQALTDSFFNYSVKSTMPKPTSAFHASKDPSEAIAVLASPEFRDLVDRTAVTLSHIGQTATLEKTEKMALGKDRARFELLGAISRFAAKLQDLDSDLTDLENQWAAIASKLGTKHNITFGSDVPIPNIVKDKLATSLASWKFKQGIKDLGFDPDTASLETLQKYATDKGFPAVGGLTLANAKMWTKLDLGDPTIEGDKVALQKKIVEEAHFKVASASAAMFLKSALKKAAPEKQAAHEKAIAAQQKALIAQAKNLHDAYTHKDGSELVKVGTDDWDHIVEGSSVADLTDAQALEIIAKGGWLPNGKQGFESKYEALKAELGGDPTVLSTQQLNTAIKERGGNYLGKMSGQDKARWLRAWAADDQAYMYKLEHDAAAKSNVGAGTMHKDHDTHPGSWGSPAGMAYRQVLSDYLNGQSWYPVDHPLTGTEIEEAYFGVQADRIAFILGYNTAMPGTPTKQNAVKHFLDTRGDLPKPSYDPEDLQLKEETADAPGGVDQDAWNMVLGAEKGAPDVLAMIASVDENQQLPGILNVTPHMLAFIPDDVKKLAVWAKYDSQDSTAIKEQKQKIRSAISYRADSGVFIPTGVPQWKDPKGKSWPLAPGSKVYKDTDTGTHYLVNPDGKTGTYVMMTGASGNLSEQNINAALTQPNYKVVLGLPDTMTFAQATKDGLNADEFTWNAVASLEQQEPSEITLPGATMNEPTLLYTIKNSKLTPPELKANADKLPLNVKMLTAWAAETSDQATLDTVAYKLKGGHYAQMQAKALLDPETPFGAKILAGFVSHDDIYNHWGLPAMEAFDKVYGTLGNGSYNHAETIYDKIIELFNPETEDLLEAPETLGTKLPKDLKLTKLAKSLGGMHSKQAWTDQEGNEWMSKAFPSDPNSMARVDAEHMANVIGRMFGFRNPETRVMNLQGKYSYVQHLKPATGSLSGKGPGQLSDETLAQAMEEHVLDWLVSNHDSHPENLLTDPDGKSIIGIDKGQAWRFFPDDKLAVGYKASNPVATWYDQFYKAVQAGTIDKKRADFVAKRVLQKAMRVQAKFDAEFAAALEEAHKNRHVWPHQYPTREKFIAAAIERKQGIAKDFHSFYSKLYAKAGWEFDFNLDKLSSAKLDDHTHLSLSQDFADDVVKASAHGKSVFFNTPDVEDSHALVWTEHQGKMMLARGELRIRQNADAVISAWLAQQSIANEVGHTSHSMNYPSAPNHEILPSNDSWYSQIVQGAKTVNTHSADGAYNEGTLTAMTSAQQQMNQAHTKLLEHEKKNPTKPFTYAGNTFVTKEQQDAWKAMLIEYSNAIDGIMAAKSTQSKTKKPAVSLASYSASKGLDIKHFIPGTKEEYPVGSTMKTSDDTYTKVAPDKWTSSKGLEYNEEEIGNKAKVNGGAFATDSDIEAESIVEVEPGKLIKVIKRKAYGTAGQFNHATGELEYGGKLEQGHTGYQYDIEYGDVSIQYRPWNSTDGVSMAQQGLMRFTVKNWEGDAAQLSDVFETLEDIGLNLTPADETSMELFYWKHLYHIMQDRKGGTTGKQGQTVEAIKAGYAANPDMSDADQLALMKTAFAKSMTQSVVDGADWYPKFSQFRVHGQKDFPNRTAGHPHWQRPDFSLKQLSGIYGTSTPISAAANHNLPSMAASGGSLSTEERLRVLGSFVTGMSSSADQGVGSSNFVFTRQNKSGGTVYYHPRVALRTNNYAFNGDKFGNISYRKSSSPWDLASASTFSVSNNELMVKYGISFVNDVAAVVFGSKAHRDAAIKLYKENGITQIQGLPIEEVFVTSASSAQAAAKKVWKRALEEESLAVGLPPAQKAAYAAYISQGLSPAQALAEAKNS